MVFNCDHSKPPFGHNSVEQPSRRTNLMCPEFYNPLARAGSHLQVPWHNAGWRHDVTGRAQVEMLTEAARTNSVSLERRNALQTGRMLQLDPAQYAAM